MATSMPLSSGSILIGSTVAALCLARLGLHLMTALSDQGTPAQGVVSPKSVSASSVSYRVKIDPSYCDEHGRVYGGELLKLIDVTAGVVAAKAAGGPCVTISADRVVFLSEILVGDVVLLSGAVNRAWVSSMEIGIRVMRERSTDPTGHQSYCCHAYLTFVAKPTPAPAPTFITSIARSLGLVSPPRPIKAQVPPIEPLTSIEHKRYLLAGRRRAHRIKSTSKNDSTLSAFRAQVFQLEQESKQISPPESEGLTEAVLLALQKEMIVDAWMRKDPEVQIQGEDVVVAIEGFTDTVKMPLKEVERISQLKGHGGYRRLTVGKPISTANTRPQPSQLRSYYDDRSQGTDSQAPLEMIDTLIMCLWIVRAQFVNSKGVLFGGYLMRWIEEASAIAARCILPSVSWSSACIDSLTFKSPVIPGEVVYIRACVIKVFDSSIEVYVVATAEDRNSPKPAIRLVSESFFTLVAVDPSSGRPLKGRLRRVIVPPGPAEEVVKDAEKRRESRLMDKMILQRVYA
ncbi:BZ3500_MvSof-1268-A1-R1_Chr6-2g08619 [Microbotryum saponariae]|uniref:BZ3500_MvSof-1268-A1-R1_Chr6-2g08619 protein n=1 Tax=Microbotryum saponariae TaxID=289078 RepID=A0A2X0L3N1_9BASI|nr:BZ3500_MvSof-1268-A1-R1_Chr6-2g08619 [Microbotryum saponariae]SDA07891.1 BZ3501_MvSof-1269-A2-R1_Chr6-1g08328 [Microbotryum saponariae]